MTQPEPESGAWQDQHGHVWVSTTSGMWGSVTGGRYMFWGNLVDDRGPMTPLLPAERPDNVPEDAWPAGIPWAAWGPHGTIRTFTPNGSEAGSMTDRAAEELGYTVPPKPEPTLADRARDMADRLSQANKVGWNVVEEETSDLLFTLAERLDELENRR